MCAWNGKQGVLYVMQRPDTPRQYLLQMRAETAAGGSIRFHRQRTSRLYT